MNKAVKHVWNIAIHVLQIFWGFIVSTTSYHLGRCRICILLLKSYMVDSMDSVTRWLDHLLNIWPFRTLKVCPIVKSICPCKFTILPKYKYFLKKWSDFSNFTEAAKISPNLVTLSMDLIKTSLN